MRVALISNLLPPQGFGGAEAYVERLATALASAHDVLVLSGTEGAAIRGAVAQSIPALPPIGSGPVRKMVWHARDQWRPATFAATYAALRDFRPDVVQIHEPQGLSGAVFSAANRLGVPVSHCLHDYNALCVRTSFFRGGRPCNRRCAECLVQRFVRGRFVRQTDVLVARSDYVAQVHSELLGISPARIVTNRHGVPLPAHAHARGDGPTLTFGYIGTLAPHKGVETLLRAWHQIRGSDRLVIAGQGQLADTVAAEAAADERLTYEGYVTGQKKSDFFDLLDVLVVPSEWEDVLPSVTVEAAARGIPCIVSDLGGLTEVPQARRFRAGDVSALREALESASLGWARDASQTLLEMAADFSEDRNVRTQERIFAELREREKGHPQ